MRPLTSAFENRLCDVIGPWARLAKKRDDPQEVVARATTTSCLETATLLIFSRVITKAWRLVTTSGLRIAVPSLVEISKTPQLHFSHKAKRILLVGNDLQSSEWPSREFLIY
jgi:hypothetical protein